MVKSNKINERSKGSICFKNRVVGNVGRLTTNEIVHFKKQAKC